MSNNANFTAQINGVGVHELYEEFNKLKLDTGTSLNERMKTILKVIETGGCLDEYFSTLFDPVINNDENTATEGNVSMLLERLGDYLIKSDESKAMTDISQCATIHSREALARKMNREAGLSEIDIETGNDDSLLQGNIVVQEDELDNLKTDNPQVLEYLKLYELLKHNLKYNIGKRTQVLLDISRVKNDIYYILNKDEVESLKSKVSGYDYVIHDIDFSDSKQLMNLMLVDVEFEQDSELWLAKDSLNTDIKELKLFNNLKDIAELVLKGYNKQEMKRELGLSYHGVNKLLQQLVDYVIISENEKNKKIKENTL